MRCPNCSADNRDSSTFCGLCGSPLHTGSFVTTITEPSAQYLKLKRLIGIVYLVLSGCLLFQLLLFRSDGWSTFNALMLFPAMGVLFLILQGKALPALFGIPVFFTLISLFGDLEYSEYWSSLDKTIVIKQLIFLPTMLVLALCSSYIPSDGFRRFAKTVWWLPPLMLCFTLPYICQSFSLHLFSGGLNNMLSILLYFSITAGQIVIYFLYSLLFIKYSGDVSLPDPDDVPSVFNLPDDSAISFRLRGRILIAIAVVLFTIPTIPAAFGYNMDTRIFETSMEQVAEWELLGDSSEVVAFQTTSVYDDVIKGTMEVFMEPEGYGYYSRGSDFSSEQHGIFVTVLALPKLLLAAGLWLGLYTILTNRKPRFFLVSGLKLIRIAQIISMILNCGLFTCMFFSLVGNEYASGMAVFTVLCMCVFSTIYYVYTLSATKDLLHAAQGHYLSYDRIPVFLIVCLIAFGSGQALLCHSLTPALLDGLAMMLFGIGLSCGSPE